MVNRLWYIMLTLIILDFGVWRVYLKTFSPAQIAYVLGVSESTVKRWVDGGHLRAERTPGGHRKITGPDLIAFLRARGRPVPSLEGLDLLAKYATLPSGETMTPDGLANLVLAGDIHVGRTLIVEQYLRGRPMDDLLDRLVGPAMVEVGVQWAEGKIDVYQEHAATLRVLSILHDLLGMLPTNPADAPLAVGGAPDGDPYFLPTAMAELTLIDIGWRTLNLGPNTPVGSLLEAITDHAPKVVWLSITSQQVAPSFFQNYPRMFAAAQEHGVRVAVGGQGVTPDVQDRLVANAFGTRLAHLKAFAHSVGPG